ncbi:MAG: RNA polymerase subunit sigma-24 [Gemmatimonadetes bacterium]|nr:RNA polymerase subunit sigma-24 [Gemmatimonadota bacterium]
MTDLPAPPRDRGDDLALVRRFLESRGEEAFRPLYRAHTPSLYALALRLAGGDVAEAEDLLQEAWTRAVRALGGFRADSALRTWLGGFVVNARRERIRSAWRTVDADLDYVAAAPGTPALVVDLERAIDVLPRGARDVFVLFDVEGHTHQEISGLLGISPGTSKSQLSRARDSRTRS